jgi:hypothetical protein
LGFAATALRALGFAGVLEVAVALGLGLAAAFDVDFVVVVDLVVAFALPAVVFDVADFAAGDAHSALVNRVRWDAVTRLGVTRGVLKCRKSTPRSAVRVKAGSIMCQDSSKN